MVNCPRCNNDIAEFKKYIDNHKMYQCKQCNLEFAKEEERPKEDCIYYDDEAAPRT